jgi:hypothetical protein
MTDWTTAIAKKGDNKDGFCAVQNQLKAAVI